MNTFVAKKENIERKWYVIDASAAPLGRITTKVAKILMGKEKPIFTPNCDCGDYVIVINSDKLVLTGLKMNDKIYYRHSGYKGGLRQRTAKEQIEKDSRFVIEHAVKGMLPKTKLGEDMFRKLFVYKDNKHTHQAQKPIVLGVE